MLKKVGLL